jgi:hypothetical protein
MSFVFKACLAPAIAGKIAINNIAINNNGLSSRGIKKNSGLYSGKGKEAGA